MEIIRVVVAFASDSQSVKIKNLLTENGYNVVCVTKDGSECLRKSRLLKPDLVILDFDLPLYTGYEVAKVLSEDKICSSIIILNDSQKSLVNEYRDDWDFACLVKPVNRSALISTISLVIRNRRKVKLLESEIQELRDSLESRKLVEKAKGILMEKQKLSEKEAFRKIQKQSMETGMPMKEIARAIILEHNI